MNRATRTATVLLALLAVSGCGAAEDAANDAADAAKDRAKQEASEAVRTAIEGQICALTGDGTLSKSEITTLSRVLDRAHDAGVPAEILDPAHEVVGNGEATAEEVRQIQAGCP